MHFVNQQTFDLGSLLPNKALIGSPGHVTLIQGCLRYQSKDWSPATPLYDKLGSGNKRRFQSLVQENYMWTRSFLSLDGEIKYRKLFLGLDHPFVGGGDRNKRD